LYLLDFEGNEIKDKVFSSHSQTVTDLSIDRSGEYLASSSTDGKVMIHGLYNSDKMEYFFNRPVNTIAIDPEYSKSKEKPIVAGGKSGKLVLFKKGWFSNKEIVIHEGEGEIYSVRWRKSLIVWSNDKGVKIFDDLSQQKIAFIPRADKTTRPDMFRCCFDWVEGLENGKEKLIVGWGTMLKIIGITFNSQTKTFKCENLSTFKVNFFICGVTPFQDNILILAFDEDEEELKKSKKYIAPQPELRVVNVKGEELICDSLTIKGYEKLFATHYKLEHNTYDQVYYIVAQSDIVAAKPRDLTDHLQWLIKKEKYVEALQCARENEKKLVDYSLYDVGKEYITYLIQKENNFSKAAQSVPGNSNLTLISSNC
jgi:vacuolar protein sorting-associated protein 41